MIPSSARPAARLSSTTETGTPMPSIQACPWQTFRSAEISPRHPTNRRGQIASRTSPWVTPPPVRSASSVQGPRPIPPMPPQPILDGYFFRTESRTEPVREWLRTLSKADKVRVENELNNAHNPCRCPCCYPCRCPCRCPCPCPCRCRCRCRCRNRGYLSEAVPRVTIRCLANAWRFSTAKPPIRLRLRQRQREREWCQR